MKIRKFQDRDAKAVCEIIRRCDMEIASKDYPKKIIEWWISKTTPEKILKNSKIRQCFVAVYGKKVVGYGDLEKDEMKRLHIIPEFQRKGIGTKLINEIEKFAIKEKIPKLILESTINAEKFYKKCGFKKVETKNCEYDGETFKLILMEKKL